MDKVCRLCLKVTDDMVSKLDENTSIKLCCLIIQLHDSLPNNICRTCHDMVVNIECITKNIVQNENKLKELLNSGCNMNEFYEYIKNQYNAETIIKTGKEDERIDINCTDPFHDESYSETINRSNVNYNMENVHNNRFPMNFQEHNVHKNTVFLPNYYYQRNHYKNRQLKRWRNKNRRTYFNPNANRYIVRKKQLVTNQPNVFDVKPDMSSKVSDEKPVEFDENSNDSESNTLDVKPDLSLIITDENPLQLNENCNDNESLNISDVKPDLSLIITDENPLQLNENCNENESFNISDIKPDLLLKITDENPVEFNENFDDCNSSNISDMKPDLSIEITDEKPIELTDNEPKVIKTEPGNLEVSIHTCLTCFQSLLSRKQLIKHYLLIHGTPNNKVKNETEATTITVKQEQVQDNSCNKNGKKLDKNPVLKKSKKPCYVCKICDRTFVQVHRIVRHGRVHGNNAFHCSQGCGFSTVYKGALKNHEILHTGDFKYKCDICGANFQVKSWYTQHMNVHNNTKPFVCDVCRKAFTMERYLQIHRARRHPEVEVRTNVPRFTCPICNIGFVNKYSYRTHMETHNGKRKFLCDICGKEFATKELLKYHNNVHLGVKPFTCSICNKKFARKFNLSVHERAHAGERHLCITCGKYFVQRSTLLRHNRQFHANNENTQNTANLEDKNLGPVLINDENGQENKLLSTNNI